MSQETETVTLEDFESLQAQLLQMKTENYNLQEQIEAAKKRSSLTPQQIAEKMRVDNLQIRVRLNQCMKEREQLNEQLKLVKIAQFLQLQNLQEASSIPDINTIPAQLRPLATEVFQLMDNVNQQVSKRSFVDAQLNELGKRSKQLSRTSETLQTQIDTLRVKQKTELVGMDEARETMQRMESETAALRNEIQAATATKSSVVNPDDLKAMTRKRANLEEEMASRKLKHEELVADLEAKIAEYNRRLDDAASSKQVMEKKMHQKVWALQAEINKRRGIVVHSSKAGSRKDSAQLFLESKKLIAQIAQKQQEVWELEERVSFSRNSLTLMANEILKKLIGRTDGLKAQQMKSVGQRIVLQLAVMDRKKKTLLESQKSKKNNKM